MWNATTYLKEARDSHGRWISGAAALGSAIDDLVKSGDLDQTSAKQATQAIARHTDMGRGLPKDAAGDKTKTLAYLAQTLRHDSITYRNQKPPDITQSKRLSKIARSVETAHAATIKQPRKNMSPVNPYHETPDSKPLDGSSGALTDKAPPIAVKVKQVAPSAGAGLDRFEIRSKLATLGDGKALTLPGGIRIVGGQVPNTAHGGKSMPRKYRINGPDGKHLDVNGSDQTAQMALNMSAQSTHPDSIGGTKAYADARDAKLTDAQRESLKNLIGQGKPFVGWNDNDEPVVGKFGKLTAVSSDGSDHSQPGGTDGLRKGPNPTGIEPKPLMISPAPDEPKVVKSSSPSAKAVEDVKVGDVVGGRTVKSIRNWPNGNVTLRWADTNGKKSTTYKPGHMLNVGGGLSQSTEPRVVRKATPTVKQAAAEPTLKLTAPQTTPKVKLKVQEVKVSAENLKPGDLVKDQISVRRDGKYLETAAGNARSITAHRKVISVGAPDENGRIPVTLGQHEHPELQPGDEIYRSTGKGFWKSYSHVGTYGTTGGDTSFKSSTVLPVRRETEVVKSGGKKIALDEHPDSRHMQAALEDALRTGQGLDALDPAYRNLPAGQSVGHVQSLMYDLAVGKTNGVGSQQVKTDAEYRRDLENSGDAAQLRRDAEESTPMQVSAQYVPSNFKEKRDVLDLPYTDSRRVNPQITIPQDADLMDYAKAQTMPGVHKQAFIDAEKAKYGADHVPSWHDYVRHVRDTNASSPLNHETTVKEWQQIHENRINAKHENLIAAHVKRLRQSDGTIPYAASLPTWDEMQMEPQSWDSLNAEIAKQADPHKLSLSGGEIAGKQFTPSFYNAGLVDDGILTHRQESTPFDAKKAEAAVRAALNSAGSFSATPLAQQIVHGYGGQEVSLPQIRERAQSTLSSTPEHLVAVNAALDKIERRVNAGNGAVVTHGHISNGAANTAMRKIMDDNGAIDATDPTRNNSKGNWTELRPGEMMVLYDGEQRDLSPVEQMEQLKTGKPGFLAFYSHTPMGPESQDIRSRWNNASSLADHQAALDAYEKFIESHKDQMLPKNQRKFRRSLKTAQKHVDNVAKGKVTTLGGKRIEYVPWQQENSATVTPRSDRGRLTLHGYTPEEAAAKLKELGIVGDLEPQVPAQSIFRSGRRSGGVTPLHSDYVRGIAQPPTTKRLTQHGITAWKGSNSGQTLEAIARTGGIQSIADRRTAGIHASGASVVGDAASGIDHVAFQSMGGGGAVGSGASVKLLMKPEVMMRRDVLLAPTDFGGGKNRYSLYKDYRDKIEAQAGEEVGKTDLWTPLSPAARQKHLDNVQKSPGSSEYNVAGNIHLNDVAAVQVPDHEADNVRRMLADLHAQGVIDHEPAVVGKAQFDAMSTGRADLPQPGGEAPQISIAQQVALDNPNFSQSQIDYLTKWIEQAEKGPLSQDQKLDLLNNSGHAFTEAKQIVEANVSKFKDQPVGVAA